MVLDVLMRPPRAERRHLTRMHAERAGLEAAMDLPGCYRNRCGDRDRVVAALTAIAPGSTQVPAAWSTLICGKRRAIRQH